MTDTASEQQAKRASFTTFEESTAEDWAMILPQLEITQSHVADRVIGLLRDLESDHGGFPVDRLEQAQSPVPATQEEDRTYLGVSRQFVKSGETLAVGTGERPIR